MDLECLIGGNYLYACRIESCEYIEEYLLSNDGGEHLMLFNPKWIEQFCSEPGTPLILEGGSIAVSVHPLP
ncbi:hypothetical protein [Dongshaea marina]|uniref:hypothetical protein n=1 Tax=Dongshaea marina TaxID=2047966 RepID=UPI000D3E2350|nr:hypothetical protein [Dongshaea marina]